jgi:phosphoglycolate phosphatase-like HAD superfamily hydrolase
MIVDDYKLISETFKTDPKIFWKTFHKFDKQEERAKYTCLYDDVVKVLKVLKEKGKRFAITTGAPKKLTSWEIELLPKEYFEKIISIHSSVFKSKPDPGSLISCLKFCKVGREEAVYIGNSGEDIEYAYNGGVDSIFLERKTHSSRTSIKPKKVIHSLLQLLEDE